MHEVTDIRMAKRLDKDPELGLKISGWARSIGSEPVQRILAFINNLLAESAKCSQPYDWASVEEIRRLAQFDAPIDQQDRQVAEWAYVIIGTLNSRAYEEIAVCFFPRVWQSA